MVLSPLSLEAIIKTQRFIKAETLSFSQTFALGWGQGRGGRGGGSLAGLHLRPELGAAWERVLTQDRRLAGLAMMGRAALRRVGEGKVEVTAGTGRCRGLGWA